MVYFIQFALYNVHLCYYKCSFLKRYHTYECFFFHIDTVKVSPLSEKGVLQIPKRTYKHITILPGIRQADPKMSISKTLS